jgi:hydroxypyruvate reductase
MSDSVPAPPDASSEALYREMRARVREIFDHALSECSIPRALGQKLQRNERYLQVDEIMYDLEAFARVLVISIGKAGYSLAENFAALAGKELTGIIAAPGAAPAELPGFQYFSGGHPLPNEESLHAGEAILQLVGGLSAETLVVFLISGGASAIAEKPIIPEISLADVVQTYRALVHSGAPIAEINAIRKHLSALKGGRLARAATPAHQLSILVSDVPEHALDALASGPTIPDSTTVKDCYDLVERYQMRERLPQSVRSLFDRGQLEETPKAGDAAFQRSHYVTVLSNTTAVNAAVEQAALAGFAVDVENACDDWDYQPAADFLLARLRELRKGVSRACLISGGEVTVQVAAESGVGGRNQQFALYCAQKIADENITVLSAGTDGVDGNSEAAGAIVDGSTLARARRQGFDAANALARFDSYPLFHTIGDAILTGPTGNNVRDLRVLLAY